MYDRIDRAFLWQKRLLESVSTKFIQALRAMYHLSNHTFDTNMQPQILSIHILG